MKHLLITLSTLSIITLTSNSISNTIINKPLTIRSSINDSLPSLFNNKFNYLSNSDWITNQSTTDHKFYSYDTSVLKNYNFPKAREVFLVDATGNLVYNPEVNIPNEDKTDIENTMQEMKDSKKVTTVKANYNAYNSSRYSTNDFSGDNNDWQYLQFGGVNKRIDISQQRGGNRIEHSNNLSETSGLYYIAKAAIENKISNLLAINLAKYFIAQSSLKGQINNELVTKIMNLMINNQDIYNFILHIPFSNDDANFALSYIFDSNNNIIKLDYKHYSYHKSKAINFTSHISPGPFASTTYTGNININYQDLYYLINNQDNSDIIYNYFTNRDLFDCNNMKRKIGSNWDFLNVWNSIFKGNLTKFLNNTSFNGIIIQIVCFGSDMWHPSLINNFSLKNTSQWN